MMLVAVAAAGILLVLGALVAVVLLANRPGAKATAKANAGSPNAGSPNAGSPNAGSPNAASTVGAFPARVFAPYWDTSNADVRWQSCPAPFITLAFVLADASGAPAWNGTAALTSMAGTVAAIRRAGKEVIASFGGQAGTELALAVADADKLAAAYLSVIDAFDLKWIDLDIEGSTTSDLASCARRNRALARVQRARPGVVLAFTLPVMPSGLAPAELDFLRRAREAGVRVDVVNVMTMDYGASFRGDQGAHAINAARNTYAQVQRLGLAGARIGITPMIGKNDQPGLVFTVAHARAVRDFAARSGYVRLLAFWSIDRDNSRTSAELGRSSGIAQKDWEFSAEFAKFR